MSKIDQEKTHQISHSNMTCGSGLMEIDCQSPYCGSIVASGTTGLPYMGIDDETKSGATKLGVERAG